MRFTPGCKCCGAGSIIFAVTVCQGPNTGPALNGATVTTKTSPGGVVVDTGTTNSSGNYTTAVLAAGNYTWTVTLTGWTTATGSVTISTGNINVSTNIRPSTIHLTDVNTTIALTYNVSLLAYTGSYTFGSFTLKDPNSHPACQTSTGALTISYSLSCGPTGTAQLRVGQGSPVAFCPDCINPTPGVLSYLLPGTGSSSAGVTVPTGTVNPLNLTCTAGANFSGIDQCGNHATLGNPAAGTITVTL